MSVYPMEVVKTSLAHKGGTKDYFLTLVVNATGQALLIKRWGAKGAIGQIKVEKYPDQASGERAYSKELTLRQSGSKGYQITDSKVLKIEDASALSMVIGRTVFPKVGPANVKHIDPSYDTSGMREPESNRDEDGNFVGNQPRHVAIDPEVVAAAERAQKEAELASMRTNPKFGRF